MKHVVLGTAGHVDHGKTTLVYALTNVQTDRLPEEQRRGITIELGFAPWRIDDDLLISVIDAPGHRKLVHHMIAGASGIDVVMLVVAADEGVMPQTREHIAACRLLGVQRAVIAITKADRADEELAEMAAEEAKDLLQEQGITSSAVVCSAKTGQGIDALRKAVLAAVAKSLQTPRRVLRTRLSVDRVFSVKGAGTVVTGTLVEGAINVGETLRVIGPNRELSASARGLHVHGDSCERAQAPTRLAINLAGVAVKDVARGDILTTDPCVRPTRILDVWLTPEHPLRRGSEATIFVGTARSVAKIQPIGGIHLLDTDGLVRLRLHTPLVVFGGDRFVLRGALVDGPTGAVVGGGVIVDAHPPANLRASKRVALLMALHHNAAAEAITLLAAEQQPRPVTAQAMASRFSIDVETLSAAADTLLDGGPLMAMAEGWVSRGAVDTLAQRALKTVAQHHRAEPLDPGLRRQTLREQLTTQAGANVAAMVVQRLLDAGALVMADNCVRLASFKGADANPQARQALANASQRLTAAALQGITEGGMNEALGVPPKQVRAVLAALVRSGQAIHVANIWFDAVAVKELQSQLVAHFQQESSLTIAQFKTLTGLGRRQSIPLLEYFDATKVTKRQGSERVPGAKLS